MPGGETKRALMASAMARPTSGGFTRSSAPVTTSVGATMRGQ
jgi:hypothetical protein